MALIVTGQTQKYGKPRRLGPLERAQRARQWCRLVAGGRSQLKALRHVGLSWVTLFDTVREDVTGELSDLYRAARQFRAHVLADRAVDVAGRRVVSVPAALAQVANARLLFAVAERLNPRDYGTKAAPPPAAAVVHHVIHLPQRGPQPDLRDIATIGSGLPPQYQSEPVRHRIPADHHASSDTA